MFLSLKKRRHTMTKPVLSVIVPVYNEEEVIEMTYGVLKRTMDGINEPYELIFVNDGSRDKSAEILRGICDKDPNSVLINFSRNFGHQPAVTAGMDYARGDAIVIIDADLQDPPAVIVEMMAKWRGGYDVVYGKRKERKGESAFKRFTAKAY